MAKKFLPLNRCSDCGSFDLDYDGWNSANLPLNYSEGNGNTFCNTCEEHDAGSSFDDVKVTAAQVKAWIGFRKENGLPTLQEDEARYIKELGEQLDHLVIMRDRWKKTYDDVKGADNG